MGSQGKWHSCFVLTYQLYPLKRSGRRRNLLGQEIHRIFKMYAMLRKQVKSINFMEENDRM